MNGHGSGKENGHSAASDVAAAEDGPKENIFLFWPNIIGVYTNSDSRYRRVVNGEW